MLSVTTVHVMRGDRLIAQAETSGAVAALLQLALTFTRAQPTRGDPEDVAYVHVPGADIALTYRRVKGGWRLHDGGLPVTFTKWRFCRKASLPARQAPDLA